MEYHPFTLIFRSYEIFYVKPFYSGYIKDITHLYIRCLIRRLDKLKSDLESSTTQMPKSSPS